MRQSNVTARRRAACFLFVDRDFLTTMSVAQHRGNMKKASRPAPQPIASATNKETPSIALEAVGTRPRRAQRRPTKPAPYELANHAKAFIEGFQCKHSFPANRFISDSPSRECVRVPVQPVSSRHLYLYTCAALHWLPTTTHSNRTCCIPDTSQVQDSIGR